MAEVVPRSFLSLVGDGRMKTWLRSILTPIALLALAALLAWLLIEREQRVAQQRNASDPSAVGVNIYALRIGAVDAAKKAYQVMLETERLAYEREKNEADIPELADLSHEVRLLTIELEHKKTLAGIDKRYPPPKPTLDLPAPPAP